MTVALVASIARPISSAISKAFSADSYGKLDAYGKLGVTDPDAVIKALFANSEQGTFYDRSDLTTMFKDRYGMTLVTADGQTVGLILDKSKGLVLGAEKLTYTTFDSLTGWAVYSGIVYPTFETVGGRLHAISVGTRALAGAVTGNLFPVPVVGMWLKLTLTLEVVSGVSPRLNLNVFNQGGALCNFALEGAFPVGTHNVVAYAATTGFTTTNAQVTFENNNASEWYIDNISVKEIAGNHAIAPSDAARPLKTSTSAADWINYDAVDDVLNTTFPSSLGSSCTVARANVGAAPTILTGQTIGTSYADSTDNAGLIIINRALTAQETTDVTAWLLAKGATS